jgi:methionyl-tRNA formyltransferase
MDKLTLFAMMDKGYEVANLLLSRYPAVVEAVVGAQDKNVVSDRYEDIQEICKKNNTAFFERSSEFSIKTKYSLAVSWRWMIDAHDTKLIVLHDSLLPRYRGFNPLVSALLNRDETIGVTALYATGEFDRGEVIAQSESRISYPIQIQEAINTVVENYKELAVFIADALTSGKQMPSTPQDESKATFSLWRDDEDYLIPWSESADYVKRFIDTVGFPYRGAASIVDGTMVRIFQAEIVEDVTIENRTPGKVIFMKDSFPVVVCGRGLLMIKEAMDAGTAKSILPLSRFRVRFKGKP